MNDSNPYLGMKHASKAKKDDEVQYLTPSELAARWNNAITTGTLANWRSNRKGPPFVKFGSRVMYPVEKLEVWESNQISKYETVFNDN